MEATNDNPGQRISPEERATMLDAIDQKLMQADDEFNAAKRAIDAEFGQMDEQANNVRQHTARELDLLQYGWRGPAATEMFMHLDDRTQQAITASQKASEDYDERIQSLRSAYDKKYEDAEKERRSIPWD
jgi:uncharacterized protein YukE